MTSCATRGHWSPLHILAVVGGFVIWWPLGLAALAFCIWGGRVSRDQVREGFDRVKTEFGGFAREQRQTWSATGNAAFDDYRTETLRRLDEERRKLEEEGRAFAEFLRNLRRARDKEEFDRFMAERNAFRQGGPATNA
ncbi:DUF2852 domain-containing protein [Labrys wisconsinensis]|uniref:DUF2852 domain-containing protein n=1 Tax=Labrys wisconsinensis TaxID=425677 RepID=A0ABU0JFE0_9HYPH|nr:DUF2852 domain-containing protein [Labrys wisconsinensis]MDQ0473007.1 hypothetical protein [Labrys wisconsinensis]